MKIFSGLTKVFIASMGLVGLIAWAESDRPAAPDCSMIGGKKICIFTGPSGHNGAIKIASD